MNAVVIVDPLHDQRRVHEPDGNLVNLFSALDFQKCDITMIDR
jgi:hypothetical protein